MRFAWFGTSIMEHYEGYSSVLYDQANLPEIGSTVTVESWRQRGYVERLRLSLQTSWPGVHFCFSNYAQGGATSRDILNQAKAICTSGVKPFDIAVLSCGINDVWRGFQGRDDEAVDLAEFGDNYSALVALLSESSRFLLCIGETPYGPLHGFDSNQMNAELADYNAVAATIASGSRAGFIPVAEAFLAAEAALQRHSRTSLWSDGVHLSELGDAFMSNLVENHLRDMHIIDDFANEK